MSENRRVEKEVFTLDERWLLVVLGPYVRVDGRIDGVVATFFDVTQRRDAQDQLRDTREMLAASELREAHRKP
jgi:two-component system CheB/CheR fusion protein